MTPSRPPRGSPRIDRRRLLLGLGFAAANAALVRALPEARRSPGVGTGGAVAAGPPRPAPVLGGATTTSAAPVHHQVVIRGGRVIDPETGYDRPADVGIDGERIAAISEEPLDGDHVIDAGGLVVAPGFIDILSYDPNPFGIWFKIADGVTTNLGMHGINADAGPWFAEWEATGSPAHYGGAFDDPWHRARLGVDPHRPAADDQLAALMARCEQQLAEGWIGVDVEPEYTPGVDRRELDALAGAAARAGMPVLFHGRYSDVEPPGTNAETLQEIVDVGRASGAAVHVQHLVSTGGTFSMAWSLDTLAAARDEGVDVTACTYPYDFWAAFLGSPRFDDGWQQRFRIGPGDLQLPGTGERLTAETFARHRRANRLAVAYAIPEDDVRLALQGHFVMVGSDSILEPGAANHPRGAGTFARTLGRYVREEGVLDLIEALAKMTILPARRLEGAAPALRAKGRLQVGADADITVFDPARIRDHATVERPARASTGVEWVLVLGQVVKAPDGLRRDTLPGRAIRPG